jgi:ribokinase
MSRVIVSLGSINADFQVRVDEPPGGETLIAHDFCPLGGGKAANIAYLARQLNHEAWLIGRVGDDTLSEQALRSLRSAHVDISGVSRALGYPTAVAMIFVPPSGKKHVVVANNANDAWTEEAMEAACARIGKAPLGSILVVDCEVPAMLVKKALLAAGRRGDLRRVLDPSFAARVDAEMLRYIEVITPNESEARALQPLSGSKSDDLIDIARGLVAQGPDIVCIKLEEGGCLQVGAPRHEYIPVPTKVHVVDTTGAGDAFTGAFAVALLEGLSPKDAARFAVAASSLAVTAYGAQPAYPRRDTLEAWMQLR